MKRQKGLIKVQARMDNCGNILVRPVREVYAKRFAKVVEEYSGHFDLDVFLQGGFGASEFLGNNVPRRYRKNLENGYTVCWLVDPWIVGHWYGYDAHCIVESGQLFSGLID